MATIFGDNNNNSLLGTNMDDSIFGLAGSDLIDGLDGDDFIDGGSDFDSGVWRTRSESFTFNLTGFTNTAVSESETETDTFEQLEGIHGTNFGDIYNVTSGFEADDGLFVLLRLGAGDDVINNDGAIVRVEYLFADAGVTIDLGAGFGRSTEAGDAALVGVDELNGVHRARGSIFDDIIRGSDSGSFFEQFEGREGDDFIDGVGGTNNEARYSFDPGGIVADLTTGEIFDGHGDMDTVQNIQRVRGSDFDDLITGDDADNRLVGQDGDDILNGGGGDDDLEPGAGNDTIDGGAGSNNEVIYSSQGGGIVASLVTGVIQDGEGGTDTVVNIQRVRGSDFNDVITASDDGDTLIGEDGDDMLIGGAGGDGFQPGLGDDVMVGGDSFDFVDYRFDNGQAVTFTLSATTTAVGAGTGTDTISGIESFLGSDFADTFTADELFRADHSALPEQQLLFNIFRGEGGNDVIQGNGFTMITYDGATSGIVADLEAGTVTGDASVGEDTVSGVFVVAGGSGDDTLLGSSMELTGLRFGFESFFGGAGDDFIDGRGGRDRLEYQSRNNGAAIVADLSAGTITDGFGNTDTFQNIEGLGGSDGDDNLTGDDGDNNFETRGGNDVVNGGAGDDVVFYDNFDGVVVDLAAGTATKGGSGSDILNSVEDVEGSLGDDQISGSIAANLLGGAAGDDTLSGADGDDELFGDEGDDVLDGGAGADEMDGGLGDDTFIVDDVGDVLSDAGGTDSVIASIAFNLAGGFENLEFTSDAGDVDGNGNSLDNVITGSDGANFIKASGGNDTVEGGAGDDTLNGQSGDDILIGGDGLDFLTGKIGDDMLFGGADNDQLRGEEGDDHMEGGGAKDRMIGKANDDVLLGQEANDKLFGNGGEDIIVGGVGKDSMNGGADADIFVLAPGDQVDTIKDFEVGIDQLDLSAYGFADFAEVEALMKEKNGRVQINLDGSDDVVRLNGVLQADLSEGDFILD